MPALSIINRLPPEQREAVEKEIVRRSFGDVRGVADWIKTEFGVDISHAAVHRHSEKVKSYLEKIRLATEHARAIVAQTGDEAGAMADASVSLAQQRLFEFLVEADDSEMSPGQLQKISAAASTLARASVVAKQHAADVRRRTKEVADKVQNLHDLPDDKRDKIRKLILGIAAEE